MWRDGGGGGRTIAGMRCGTFGGKPSSSHTVLLITNVHHDNETTFPTAENGFDNLACSWWS